MNPVRFWSKFLHKVFFRGHILREKHAKILVLRCHFEKLWSGMLTVLCFAGSLGRCLWQYFESHATLEAAGLFPVIHEECTVYSNKYSDPYPAHWSQDAPWFGMASVLLYKLSTNLLISTRGINLKQKLISSINPNSPEPLYFVFFSSS